MRLSYCYKISEGITLLLKADNSRGYYYSTDYITDPSIECFRESLLKIYEYIIEYGIKSIANSISIGSLKNNKAFIDEVHEGLALAQEELIDNIIQIDSDIKREKTCLKQANINRDEKLKVKSIFRLEELYIRECIFRKLADTIAWGYIVRDHASARRLYIGRDMDSIDESKFSEYKRFVREFNRNKSKFGLLTDITSFIQLGDLICIEVDAEGHQTWRLIELKSGKINHKLLNILSGEMHITEEIMKSLTQKEVNQALRVIKQSDRANRSYSVIRSGSGTDAAGDYVRIVELDHVKTDYYVERIRNILKKSSDDEWAIDVIDDCLYVAAYNTNIPMKQAYLSFTEWMNQIDVRYPITNFQSTFYCPLCKPPFLSGIDKTDIIDITLGEKKILACLDFDTWLEMGKDIGLDCDWLSKKESANHIKSSSTNYFYKYNNRIIRVSKAGRHLTMGDAIPARIFFEFLRPISAMNLLNETLSIF